MHTQPYILKGNCPQFWGKKSMSYPFLRLGYNNKYKLINLHIFYSPLLPPEFRMNCKIYDYPIILFFEEHTNFHSIDICHD